MAGLLDVAQDESIDDLLRTLGIGGDGAALAGGDGTQQLNLPPAGLLSEVAAGGPAPDPSQTALQLPDQLQPPTTLDPSAPLTPNDQLAPPPQNLPPSSGLSLVGGPQGLFANAMLTGTPKTALTLPDQLQPGSGMPSGSTALNAPPGVGLPATAPPGIPLPATPAPTDANAPPPTLADKAKGLLGHFFGTYSTGTTFADRLIAASMMARGDLAGGANYLQGIEQQTQKTNEYNQTQALAAKKLADQQAMNRAFLNPASWDTDPTTGKQTFNKAKFQAQLPADYSGDLIGEMKNVQDLAAKYDFKTDDNGNMFAVNPNDPTDRILISKSTKPQALDTKDKVFWMPDSGVTAGGGGGGLPPGYVVTPQDRDALTRMIATEAGGEGQAGMTAAGAVALNRLRGGYGGATSLQDVINAPGQFEGMKNAANVTPADYQAAQAVADQLLSGQAQDPTNGATQFLNPDLQAKLGRAQPSWAVPGQGQRIGNHVFYGGDQSAASAQDAGTNASGMLSDADALKLGLPPRPGGHYYKPPAASDEGPELPDNLKGLSGQDLLNALPPEIANQIKAMSEGRAALPAGYMLKTPHWQYMQALASAYDPRLDITDMRARQTARNDFASSKGAGGQRMSLNTAIAHAGELDNLVDTFGNVENVPLAQQINQGKMAWANNQRDNANYLKWAVNVNGLSDEMERTFRGAAGSEQGIQDWKKILDPTQGPTALHAAIHHAMDMLSQRLQSLAGQYNTGMGTSKTATDMLSSANQQTYARLTGAPPPEAKGWELGVPDAPSDSTAPAAPAPKTQQTAGGGASKAQGFTPAPSAPPASMLKVGQVTHFKGRPGGWTLNPKTLQSMQVE